MFIQKIIFFLAFILIGQIILAQQPENRSGVELYEKGDYKAAIATLKDTRDNKEMYYLALSYEKINEIGKTRGLLEKCVANTYDIYTSQFSDSEKKGSQNAGQPLAEVLQRFKSDYEFGMLSARKAEEIDKNFFKGKDSAFKADTLKKLILITQSSDVIYSNLDKAISPIKILDKPRAYFPKDLSGSPILRRNQAGQTTTVALLIIFGADGTIKVILPADQIVDSFTIESWKSAINIKFNPAIMNGSPVTSYSIIKYSFTIG